MQPLRYLFSFVILEYPPPAYDDVTDIHEEAEGIDCESGILYL